MYEKARRGESIELSPRRISIFQFDVERSLEDRLASISCQSWYPVQYMLHRSSVGKNQSRNSLGWHDQIIFQQNTTYVNNCVVQTKCDLSGDMFKRNIHPFPLCRFWKGSWQVINMTAIYTVCLEWPYNSPEFPAIPFRNKHLISK